MKRVLITGGAGFIGSHLTDKLVRLGFKVTVLDNFSSGKKENLSEVINDINIIEGDIRVGEVVKKALAGVDTVFHLAAIPTVSESVANPIKTHDVNINGTLNILIISKEQKVKRFIFSSSCAVYGENDNLPLDENSLPDPKSPYAISKLTGEYYCKVFNDLYGLETVSLRYFNVFGPRQDPTSEYSAVIPKFITSIINKQNPKIYGDGKQTRDFIYVDNVIQANILAAKTLKGLGGVYNVASHRQTSLLSLVEKLKKITETSITLNFLPKRTGDILHSYASISKSKDILGYGLVCDLYEGLEITNKYILERIDSY
jgi:UDP-glucose 4-epimerase